MTSQAHEIILPEPGFNKCWQGSVQAVKDCTNASTAAVQQSNQLSTQHAASVKKDSLNKSADREAQVTKKIADILKAARAKCDAGAQFCKQNCQGSLADIAQGCTEEIKVFTDQLDSGKEENLAGYNGSKATDGKSTGLATKDSGGGGPAGAPAGATGAGAAGGGGPTSDAAQLLALTQKPTTPNGGDKAGGKSAGSASVSGGSAGASGAGGAAQSLNAGTQFSRAGTGSHGSGGVSGYGTRSLDESGAPESNLQRMGQVLKGNALLQAAEAYCTGAGKGDVECESMMTKQFCSDSGRSQCPSCSGSNPASLQGENLQQVCTSACAQDPKYGPQLADRCRQVMNAGTEDDTDRAPAAAMNQDTGDQFGPSIFAIHSRAISHHFQK
ncbi:MAG: hypothetical protein AB7F86_16975 [Bdellovibrionales bacterium]